MAIDWFHQGNEDLFDALEFRPCLFESFIRLLAHANMVSCAVWRDSSTANRITKAVRSATTSNSWRSGMVSRVRTYSLRSTSSMSNRFPFGERKELPNTSHQELEVSSLGETADLVKFSFEDSASSSQVGEREPRYPFGYRQSITTE
jgi:hypothetical protein